MDIVTGADPLDAESLGTRLRHSPRQLQFGTSGRRGLVVDLTQLEVYINALAELEYLQTLPLDEGEILHGDEFYLSYDLRPSSTQYVGEKPGCGEIAQAIAAAIVDAGMRPSNLGAIPTPALASYAIGRRKGSIMVTGSHIPFDRNGYKTNTSRGELLKHHELPIARKVAEVRERIYAQTFADSAFHEFGRFKSGHRDLPPVSDDARRAYVNRYVQFAGEGALAGVRLLFYQHSAVGRDLLPEILRLLGAEVICAGRSDTFVPIDTENMDAPQLATIQELADAALEEHGRLDAVLSTDGDSDRPLVLNLDPRTGKVQFYCGDLLGMIAAEYLGADAVVVPISCNDAIDRSPLAAVLEPKTRIGSPYVIAGMQAAAAKGRRVICGWEANGGFMTGSGIVRSGRLLEALPTRDALLPIVAVLLSAQEKGLSLPELFATLPKRYSSAGLLRQFPRTTALQIMERFTPADPGIREVLFDGRPTAIRVNGATVSGDSVAGTTPPDETSPSAGRQLLSDASALGAIRADLRGFFSADRGFAEIERLNYTDGVRVLFANGDVTHIRPSGNADELRIYAVADTKARADAIVATALAEPDGILRSIERSVIGNPL